MLLLLYHAVDRLGATPPWVWHGGAARDELIVGLLTAIGISAQNKADVLGYSLGGAIVGRLLRSRSELFHKRIFLSPAFFSCIDPAFAEAAAIAPRKVHAYETLDEIKMAFTETAFGFYADALPSDFILGGLVRLRQSYGSGYYASMVEALLADGDVEDDGEIDSAIATATADTLIVIGDRDNCVNPSAVQELAHRTGVACVVLKDVGHVGGPQGSSFHKTIFTIAASHISAHLLGRQKPKL